MFSSSVFKNFNNIFSIVTIFLLICLLVFIIVRSFSILYDFTQSSTNRNLLPFSSPDIHFDPYPADQNIDNPYDCNAKSLHKCDMNDPTTLFGCKELLVRCHHFDKDTKYFENGQVEIIPANENENEGYALAITTLAEDCNPYHGDLILVAKTLETNNNTSNRLTNEYLLLCQCKYPGYIGNDNILGNCTTVFICNNKIDDINKPLEQINCVCSNTQKSDRRDDGVPVCTTLLVKDANEMYKDWTSLVQFSSKRTRSIDDFNITLRDNLHVSTLLDPCTNSLVNPSREIEKAGYNERTKTCYVHNSGYPVVTGMLDPTNNTNERILDGVLATDNYSKIRVGDSIIGKHGIYGIGLRRLYDIYGFDNQQPLVVVPIDGFTFGGGSDSDSYLKEHQISLSVRQDEFVAIKCYPDWPTYICKTLNDPNTISYGLTFYFGKESPWSYSDKETWNNNDLMIKNAIDYTIKDGIRYNNSAFFKVSKAKPYGLQWVSSDNVESNNEFSGLLMFNNEHDYNVHHDSAT